MPQEKIKSSQSRKGKGFYPTRKFFDKHLFPKKDLALKLITRFVESNWTIQEVNELCEMIASNHSNICFEYYEKLKEVGFPGLPQSFAETKGLKVED